MKGLVIAIALSALCTGLPGNAAEDDVWFSKSLARRAAECAGFPDRISREFDKEFPHNGPGAQTYAQSQKDGLLVYVFRHQPGCHVERVSIPQFDAVPDPAGSLIPDLSNGFVPQLPVYVVLQLGDEAPDAAAMIDSPYVGDSIRFLVLEGTVDSPISDSSHG